MKPFIQKFAFVALLASMGACTSIHPASKQQWVKPDANSTFRLSSHGQFCTIESHTEDLGGIAVSQPDDQQGIGDCRHAKWTKDDVVVLFFGDDTQQASDDQLDEELDYQMHPGNYYSKDEIAEIDCTQGSGCAALKKGIVMHFHHDEFKPFSIQEIDMLQKAARSAKLSGKSVAVVGFTDSTGTAKYNKKLSIRRAESIKDLLVDSGMSPKLILARGEGDAMPVASNKTESGRAQNRRVELHGDAQ